MNLILLSPYTSSTLSVFHITSSYTSLSSQIFNRIQILSHFLLFFTINIDPTFLTPRMYPSSLPKHNIILFWTPTLEILLRTLFFLFLKNTQFQACYANHLYVWFYGEIKSKINFHTINFGFYQATDVTAVFNVLTGRSYSVGNHKCVLPVPITTSRRSLLLFMYLLVLTLFLDIFQQTGKSILIIFTCFLPTGMPIGGNN